MKYSRQRAETGCGEPGCGETERGHPDIGSSSVLYEESEGTNRDVDVCVLNAEKEDK